jgi:hypothetical protein
MKATRPMLRMLQMLIVVVSLATVSLAALPAHNARAGENAIVEMTIGKIGFVVGVSRGDGRVFYNGRQANLEVNGLRIGLTIGASFANMRGEAYNLKRLEDIAGTYVTAQASVVAMSTGGQNLVLVNEKGVRLVLWGEQKGLDASLDTGGMLISLR